MGPQVVIRFTREGVQPSEILATSEAEEKTMRELLEKIQPCLDVADAILKKGDLGPTG